MGKWPVEALLSSELPPWVTEAYLIPQSIPQVQLRWCSSKWIHLKSEGLGGSIPQFFSRHQIWSSLDMELDFLARAPIRWESSQAKTVWCQQLEVGPEAMHGSGRGWPMVSSPACYILCAYITVSWYLFPHSLWKCLWFYLYSLNPQILLLWKAK